MAETELAVLAGDCLDRRMDCAEFVKTEVAVWEADRNHSEVIVRWRFTTQEARQIGGGVFGALMARRGIATWQGQRE
jgi:hypothetical protein